MNLIKEHYTPVGGKLEILFESPLQAAIRKLLRGPAYRYSGFKVLGWYWWRAPLLRIIGQAFVYVADIERDSHRRFGMKGKLEGIN
jgi:hypothetical protein